MFTQSPITSTLRYENGQSAPAVALAFFALGFFCLSAALGILVTFPELVLGDWQRPEWLGFGVLVTLGFVASFVFGAAYLVSPVMASSSLFSGRWAFAHCALHALGLGWLVVVFGGMPFLEQPMNGLWVGLGLIVAGALLLIVNLFVTASRWNRWEADQLLLLSALFWLGASLLMGAATQIPGAWLGMWGDFPRLAETAALAGLVGFLWFSLLGFSLKLFNLFLVSEKSAGTLSWFGWISVNSALLLLMPTLLLTEGTLLPYGFGLLAVGSLAILADIVRLWLAARRPLDWALSGAFVGLITGFLLMGWGLLGGPLRVAEGAEVNALEGQLGVLFVVGVLGTLTITWLLLALRLIPFLVWRLRCAPSAARQVVPPPRALRGVGGSRGLAVCLLLGWGYLSAGQWMGAAAGIQLGAVCLLVGLVWFLFGLYPALGGWVLPLLGFSLLLSTATLVFWRGRERKAA